MRISLSGMQERSFLYELRPYLICVKVGEIVIQSSMWVSGVQSRNLTIE